MHRRLKERLIGAAVLVMLAVIFIPMLLDDTSHTESEIKKTNIPTRPDDEFISSIVPISEIEKPAQQPESGATEPVSETVISDDSEQTVFVAEETPPPVESIEPATKEIGDVGLMAWVVQLGSFNSEKNANNLNEKLRSAGYSSFVEPLKQGGKIIYRVRIGPELLRSDAQDLKDRLNKQMKMEGIIQEYP